MPTINGTPNDDVLIGTPDADEIFGFGGNDIIDGNGGGDDMRGGEGDDIYIVRHANDFIVENSNQGEDIVYASISYVMGAFVNAKSMDTLSTIQHNDTTPINLTSFASTHTIIGNYGNNILSGASLRYIGLLGDDTYDLNAGSNAQIIENEGEGNDIVRVTGGSTYELNAGASVETMTVFDVLSTTNTGLVGNELTQTIIGNEGGNSLDGGSGGNDILIGGGGNDVYHIRTTSQQIVENANGGIDAIVAYIDFALGTNVNIEILKAATGTAPIALLGNDLANFLVGNDGDNILNGGPAGAADTLQGGLGNDTYRVYRIGDVVQETAGGGTDIIFVHFSYELPAVDVENLSAAEQAGTESLNFTGNTLNNLVIGNFGANQLDGGFGGDDTLYGLAGNDTYIVRNAGDQAVEQAGQGSDIVYAYATFTLNAGSEVETLSTVTHAATDAINLTGNELGQTVVGNAGANTLDGKGGNDLLAGLAGADSFAFTTALGAGNVDTIFDFSAVDDVIVLDHAAFGGLSIGGLPAGAFALGSAAQEGDDRIIYNSANGQLLFDADGSGVGAAIHFATLQGAPAITSADFLVI